MDFVKTIDSIFGKKKTTGAAKISPYTNTTWQQLGSGRYNPDNVSLTTYKSMIQQDAQVRAGIDFLKILTIGSGYDLNISEGSNIKVADFLRDSLDSFGYKEQNFADALDEILTAFWAGYSITEMIPYYDYDTSMIKIYRFNTADPATFENGLITSPSGELLAAKQNTPYGSRHFYNADDERKTEYTSSEILTMESYHSQYFGHQILSNVDAIPIEQLLYYSVNTTFGNPYGESFCRPVYKNWFTKDNLIRFWNISLEKYGMPFTVGRSPNPEDETKISAVINSVMPRTGIFLGDQATLDVIETKKSAEDFKHAIYYHDQQIMLRLLIPSLTLQQEKVGSYSLGEVHFNVFLMRLARLRTDLENLIQRKVIDRLVQWNYGMDEPIPKYKFKEIKHQDLSKIADVIEKMIGAQVIAPNEDWIREKLNFPTTFTSTIVKDTINPDKKPADDNEDDKDL